MPELQDLYQQIILDHNRSPKNFRALDDANRSAEGYNPLCGDKVTIYVRLEGDVIQEVGFQGSGCAISKASASLMTTAVKGKTVEEARELFEKFHAVITGHEAPDRKVLGKLAALAGVRQFPVRVKCASLSWHTLNSALDGSERTVSTE
jgi:nitrogen fixation NifU-like protein